MSNNNRGGYVTIGDKSVDVWPRVFGSPEFALPSEKERVHRDREKLIVLTKISLRPGNNLDVMEALGLVPPAPKPNGSGAALKMITVGLTIAGLVVLFIPTSMVLGI